MAKNISLDRWLIWCIAITIFICIALWSAIQKAIIEIENNALEESRYNIPFHKIEKSNTSGFEIYQSKHFLTKLIWPF